MNKLLDEETISVVRDEPAVQAETDGEGVRLNSVNALKHQARYLLAQQQGLQFENSLLKAGAELLSLTVSVKRMQCPSDMHAFRTGIKNALTELKYKVAKLDYPPSVADKTCFLFAVMLDEQILHSAWGEASGWENQTLVSELFGIKNGGEQFYVVTERALLQPVLLVDLLEVIYIMVKMGFRGRFRVTGKEQLDALMKRIEECVFSQKVALTSPERMPAIQAENEAATRATRPRRPVSFIRPFLLFVLLVTVTWGAVYYWYQVTLPQKASAFTQLTSYTKPIYEQAGAQDVEYVYYSTPEDIQGVPTAATSSSTAQDGNTWTVQLATFNTAKEAERFIETYRQQLPNATTDVWRGMFRVISISGSRFSAARTLDAAKAAGISDAFMLSGKN